MKSARGGGGGGVLNPHFGRYVPRQLSETLEGGLRTELEGENAGLRNVKARGGGVLRCCLDGGARLKPPNPYPSLRVILAEKGTHY